MVAFDIFPTGKALNAPERTYCGLLEKITRPAIAGLVIGLPSTKSSLLFLRIFLYLGTSPSVDPTI